MEFLFLSILIFPVCFILTSFLHELGHALFGLIRGGKFMFMIVGPFMYGRKQVGDPYRFELHKDVQYYGGVVAVLPARKHVTSNDYLYCILGGPLVSFLCGLLSMPVVWLTFKNVPLGIGIFLLNFCLLSIALGIVTSIPYPKRITHFIYSDGKRIYEHLKGNVFDYYVWKNANVVTDKAYRCNQDECEVLKQSSDPVYQFFGSYYLLNNEQGNSENEQAFLRDAFAHLSEKQRQALLMDASVTVWLKDEEK